MTGESYEDLMKPLHERFGGETHPEEDVVLQRITAARSTCRCDVATRFGEAQGQLRQTLLGYVHAQSHAAFERLVIDVLLRMGYGSRRRDLERCLGRSHDGGIDGVVEQDELALDLIYIQAKRLKPGSSVPVGHVRDFVGSLDGKRASKGLFVTTGLFTAGAADFLRGVSRRVVLIDGPQLADIMIRHNIGVRVKETFQFKEVEASYFAALPARA
jgi:restriction system protein